jgi:hypothetical protein
MGKFSIVFTLAVSYRGATRATNVNPPVPECSPDFPAICQAIDFHPTA